VGDGLLSYQLQAENFVAVARGQATPLIPLVESVVNTFALESLVTSVPEKRSVDIAVPTHIEDAYRAHATGNRKGAHG
jgi:hypothetical protein